MGVSAIEAVPLIGELEEQATTGSLRYLIVAGLILVCVGSALVLGVLAEGPLQRAELDFTGLSGVQAGDVVPDVFCFTVMGQPAQERPLLLSQQSKGKGLFLCPAHAVFGQANVTPVTHPLPTLVFGVAKGGRWGTALNTPVFKEIWKKAPCQQGYRWFKVSKQFPKLMDSGQGVKYPPRKPT